MGLWRVSGIIRPMPKPLSRTANMARPRRLLRQVAPVASCCRTTPPRQASTKPQAPARRKTRQPSLRLPPRLEARVRLLTRSEEHTSELQSLMRTSYAVFGLKKYTQNNACFTYTHCCAIRTNTYNYHTHNLKTLRRHTN